MDFSLVFRFFIDIKVSGHEKSKFSGMLCPTQKHKRTKEEGASESLYLETGHLKPSSQRRLWPVLPVLESVLGV